MKKFRAVAGLKRTLMDPRMLRRSWRRVPPRRHPYCGQVWGSLVKADPAMSQAQVMNVRSGQHYCFDRLVIDLNGPVAGYTVRYVPQVVQDGSGLPVPLRGQAFIQLTVNAPAYDRTATPRTTRRTRMNSST